MKKLVLLAGLASMTLALAAPVQADHERGDRHVARHHLQHGDYVRGYRDHGHHRHRAERHGHREYYGARYCADGAHYYRPHYHVHPRVYASYYAGYPVYARDSNLTLILSLPL